MLRIEKSHTWVSGLFNGSLLADAQLHTLEMSPDSQQAHIEQKSHCAGEESMQVEARTWCWCLEVSRRCTATALP